MQSHLKRLKMAFEDLSIRDGFGGVKFYDGDGLENLGSQCHSGAIAVMVLGDINRFFNCYVPYSKDGISEFDELFRSFGFGFDYYLDTSSVGIYILDGFDFSPVAYSCYADLLKHPRWKSKAEHIKSISGNRCANCGVGGRLDAHHSYYKPMRYGFYPWEYPLSTLKALCRTCHVAREGVELQFRAWSSHLSSKEILALKAGVDSVAAGIGTSGVLHLLEKFSQLGYRQMSDFARGGELTVKVMERKEEP